MRRQMMTRLASFLVVVWMVSFSGSRADNIRKLGATPLDSIEFEDTELGLALEYLSAKLKEAHPNASPVNFILVDPKGDLAKRRVTLRLRSVPWGTALKYTCEQANTSFQIEPIGILVGDKTEVDRMVLQRSKILKGPGSNQNQARINAFRIKSVSFDGATLAEVAEYLRQAVQARIADSGTGVPLNVLIKENPATPVATRRVSLDLENVPMSELIHYATGLAGCRFRVDARAIVIGEAEDLARPPGGPPRPAGPIFNQLASKTIQSIDIPAGSTVPEFMELVRQLGGVNGIAMTEEGVAASRLSMHGVSVLELVRYFNEVSGTAFRLDPNAYLIVDDPAVPAKPRPPESENLAKPGTGGAPNGLGFDDP